MTQHLLRIIIIVVFVLSVENGEAREFEGLGKAVAEVLNTTKAFQVQLKYKKEKYDAYYSKNKKGKAKTIAVVQKGIYPPDCTHTWVIGLNARSMKVIEIRVVEMSCHHAFPTNQHSFLSQFYGRGPKDVRKLKKKVITVAKATGSSELTIKAVQKSIISAKKKKGKI